jgi:uncharacterized membrane protein
MSLMQQIPIFIIFDLIGEGFEPTIWHIRGKPILLSLDTLLTITVKMFFSLYDKLHFAEYGNVHRKFHYIVLSKNELPFVIYYFFVLTASAV